ncbi:hypothetical protein SBV1_300003 [Verrucomicrobia bacterium]|nr:hypothetical protein SBV1_300003 [Verrucomicrobiota bacterium]
MRKSETGLPMPWKQMLAWVTGQVDDTAPPYSTRMRQLITKTPVPKGHPRTANASALGRGTKQSSPQGTAEINTVWSDSKTAS